MSNVVSFVEESCFSGDQFRSVRRQSVYTVNIYGQFRGDFMCDHGIWYDYSDDYLLAHLYELHPDCEWAFFTFHHKIDHSEICILHPESGKQVGAIYVRRGATGSNLSCEIVGANIVPYTEFQQRMKERDERYSSSGEGKD